LKELYLSKVKEFENKKNTKKPIFLVYVPFQCLKVLKKVHRKLVFELEKKLNKVSSAVLIVAKRTINSKWVIQHKSQMRPRNRTLTAVYEAILDDLCLPSTILGKRTRVRVDQSSFTRVYI
jgi:small subunit ribosomal protein S7e